MVFSCIGGNPGGYRHYGRYAIGPAIIVNSICFVKGNRKCLGRWDRPSGDACLAERFAPMRLCSFSTGAFKIARIIVRLRLTRKGKMTILGQEELLIFS